MKSLEIHRNDSFGLEGHYIFRNTRVMKYSLLSLVQIKRKRTFIKIEYFILN